MESDISRDTVLLHELRSLDRPVENSLDREVKHQWLVNEPVDRDDILVSVLREEFGDAVMESERPVAVELAICPIEPANGTLATAVIPSVLTSWDPMRVELDSEPVFSAVLDCSEEISPRDFCDIRVAVVRCYRPVGILEADVVEASISNVREILFGDECSVVLLNCRGCGAAEPLGQGPFINDPCLRGVRVEE